MGIRITELTPEISQRLGLGVDFQGLPEEALGDFQRDVMTWGPDRMLVSVVEHALDGFSLESEIIDRA